MIRLYLVREIDSPRDAVHDQEEEAEMILVYTELHNIVRKKGTQIAERLRVPGVRGVRPTSTKCRTFVHGHDYSSTYAYCCADHLRHALTPPQFHFL